MKRLSAFFIALLLISSTAFAGNGALKAKTGMYELGTDTGWSLIETGEDSYLIELDDMMGGVEYLTYHEAYSLYPARMKNADGVICWHAITDLYFDHRISDDSCYGEPEIRYIETDTGIYGGFYAGYYDLEEDEDIGYAAVVLVNDGGFWFSLFFAYDPYITTGELFGIPEMLMNRLSLNGEPLVWQYSEYPLDMYAYLGLDRPD